MTTGAPVIPIKQGDLDPPVRVYLTDPPTSPGGPRPPADLSDFTGVVFRMTKVGADTRTVDDAVAALDVAGAFVEYQWSSGDTDDPGIYECEFTLEKTGGGEMTWPSAGYFLVRIVARLCSPYRLPSVVDDPPQQPGSIAITPVNPNFATGTVQLTGVVLDEPGLPILDLNPVLLWSSSAPAVATVDAAGLVTAVTPGAATITALYWGVQGSTVVTVETPAATVDHVAISPASGNITVGGGALALTVDPKNAANSSLLGRVVTWETQSGGTVVLSVSGAGYTGTVTPVSVGSDSVRAICEGVASAWVSIAVVATNQPSGFTQITETNWDTPTEDNWVVSAGAGAVHITTDATAPKSPSNVLETTFVAGASVGGQAPCLLFPRNDNLTSLGYDSVYLGFYVKYSSNWVGHTSQVNKLFYLGWGTNGFQVYVNGTCVGAAGANVLSVHLQNCPRSIGGNDPTGAKNFPAAGVLGRGQWAHVEILIIPNSANGVADGILQVWVNGVLGQGNNISNLAILGVAGSGVGETPGGYPAGTKLRRLRWNPVWGGAAKLTRPLQYIYLDYTYLSGKAGY